MENWWAPKPWKAKIKSIDFREGGSWLYAMVGPNGEESWARSEFKTVEPLKRFVATDYFCDEKGNKNNDLPSMEWNCEFNNINNGSVINIQITFENEQELKKIIEMGFEEGFTSALENLDELLDK